MRLLPLLLSGIVLLTVQTAAAKSEASLDLKWHAPPSCPTGNEVRQQIFSLLPSDAEPPHGVSFRGEVIEEAGIFRLRLLLSDGEFQEERSYQAPSCEEVVGAGTVAIALLMQSPDGKVSTSTSEETPTTTPSGQGAAATETAPPPNKTQKETNAAATKKTASPPRPGNVGAARDASSIAIILNAPTLSASFALLPRVGLGLDAGAGLEVSRFRFLLSGTWYPQITLDSPDFADSRVQVRRANVSLSACRWFGPQDLAIAPCLDLNLEHLRARGEGENISSQDQRTNWLSLGPALLGRAHIQGPLSLVGGLSLHVQTSRPQLVISGQGEIAQIGLLQLTTNLGLEWIL